MKNILLIYGGDSVESDISVLTAMQIYHFLDKVKYRVIPCYIRHGMLHTFGGKAWLNPHFYADFTTYKRTINLSSRGIRLVYGSLMGRYKHIDCAVLCTHGGAGEDGGLQGMLELFNIPYTSCGLVTSAVCMDKWATSERLSLMNLSVPKTHSVSTIDLVELAAVYEQFDGKVIVKPNSLGSSIGVSSPKDFSQLEDAVRLALIFDTKVLLQEKVCNLVELNCAAVRANHGIVVSDIERPVTASDILNFEDKYIGSGKMSGAEREFPAKISDKLAAEIKSITLRIYTDMNMLGSVRIDFLYDSVAEKLFVNEINTIPGSLAYYLFELGGLNAQSLVDEIINSAIARSTAANRRQKNFKSSILTMQDRGSKLKV